MLQSSASDRVNPFSTLDERKTGEALDQLIDLISEVLPVDAKRYPALDSSTAEETIEFCLRHSALHFSKIAGRLAAWVESADHGRYADFQILESIVAGSLVNSLKLADEIGLSGSDILEQIRERFDQREPAE